MTQLLCSLCSLLSLLWKMHIGHIPYKCCCYSLPLGAQDLDRIRLSTYRTACKLRFVQKKCNCKYVSFPILLIVYFHYITVCLSDQSQKGLLDLAWQKAPIRAPGKISNTGLFIYGACLSRAHDSVIEALVFMQAAALINMNAVFSSFLLSNTWGFQQSCKLGVIVTLWWSKGDSVPCLGCSKVCAVLVSSVFSRTSNSQEVSHLISDLFSISSEIWSLFLYCFNFY